MLRDMFPLPGQLIKQWVVDARRERKWEKETCPRRGVRAHDDNTGALCRNEGAVPVVDLAHDCCGFCDDSMEEAAQASDVLAWEMRRAARPPICADRDKLSDQRAWAPLTQPKAGL